MVIMKISLMFKEIMWRYGAEIADKAHEGNQSRIQAFSLKEKSSFANLTSQDKRQNKNWNKKSQCKEMFLVVWPVI